MRLLHLLILHILIRLPVIPCIRDPRVCGGRLLPALHPEPQPDQPGGDQRPAGLHEAGEGGSWGEARFLRRSFELPHCFVWHTQQDLKELFDLLEIVLIYLGTDCDSIKFDLSYVACDAQQESKYSSTFHSKKKISILCSFYHSASNIKRQHWHFSEHYLSLCYFIHSACYFQSCVAPLMQTKLL